MGEMVNFTCPNATSASAYLADAPNATAAVVVLQEWWGLNEQIRGVAERCAAAGFSALAPDLYHGRVTQDPDEAGHMMDGLDWVGATEQEVNGAVQYLRATHTKVAVMGFCMGGALALIAGAKLPDVDAGICYYGIPPAEAADPSTIKTPLIGHFATRDDWCTPAAVAELEATLQNAGATYELYHYDAEHGFFNETNPNAHDSEAAALSWQRTLAFMNAYL